MKWIQTQNAQGQVIPLALDASGQLYTVGAEQQMLPIAPARALLARLHGKRAQIFLPEPYGQVSTDEITAVNAWFAHLDLSGERRKKPLPAWVWAWGILGSIMLAVVLTFTVAIPWMAASLADDFPLEWEKDLAQGTLESLSSEGFSDTKIGPEQQARYQELFKAVAARSKYGLPIRLEIRNWNQPNAFAVPGGVVLITDPMLALMRSEDEFTAVMAHEVGHLEHRHGIRSVLQQTGSWVVISLMLGDPSGVSILTTALPNILIDSAYSREFEREADQYAFDTLEAMGKSPTAFADMMRNLMKATESESSSGGMQYFSSHPPSQERIDAAEQAARD
jgi:Zn-dependent protease with chaperone function